MQTNHHTSADLIQDNSVGLFILESPYEDEMEAGVALSGRSGIGVSKALFDKDEPFGCIYTQLQPPFSAVNTFQEPIALEYKDKHQLLVALSNLDEYPDPNTYKQTIKNIVRQTPGSESVINNYCARVASAFSRGKITKIVVCGLIAQAIFEHAFNLTIPSSMYGRPVPERVLDIPVDIFYIRHPSARNSDHGISSWLGDNLKLLITRLRQFINQ